MFITFEGIDFSGKSTQVELLKDYFIKRGKEVEIIREPGGTGISEKIRDILLDRKNHGMFMETEILLFSASRAQLVREKIRPYMAQGIYVISDRFHDSSTAYQGFGRGILIEQILEIHKLSIGETLPDITFFIDIPVEEAERRKNRNSGIELDRIEVSEYNFYENVRNGYLSLASQDKRIRVINGMDAIEDVHRAIISEVEKREVNEKKTF
jgi:dTMP kinase